MQAYIKTDQILHLLSQVIAKANRTYVTARQDDSHTNLYFDALGSRIVGRWIKVKERFLLFSLNLNDWEYEWLDASLQIVNKHPISGKTISELEQEIADRLDTLGLDPAHFTDALHYEIPDYPFASETFPGLNETGTDIWKHVRNLANQACNLLLGYLQTPEEIRIWPHHFDTGIYAVTKNKIGIGFGLAMQDTLLDSPYFYISGYSEDGPVAYDNIPDLSEGKWIITEEWKGAALPLSETEHLNDREQDESVKHFLLSTADWFNQLRP